MVDTAHGAGLIQAADVGLLANGVYDFRNSIVHAKYDQKATITVDRLLDRPPHLAAWRKVLMELATEAMNLYGR
jgi:hypothetical protein